MTITVFQYTEEPLTIENVVDIKLRNEGEEVIIVSSTDGEVPFDMDDVMRWEATK